MFIEERLEVLHIELYTLHDTLCVLSMCTNACPDLLQNKGATHTQALISEACTLLYSVTLAHAIRSKYNSSQSCEELPWSCRQRKSCSIAVLPLESPHHLYRWMSWHQSPQCRVE